MSSIPSDLTYLNTYTNFILRLGDLTELFDLIWFSHAVQPMTQYFDHWFSTLVESMIEYSFKKYDTIGRRKRSN